MTAAVSSRMAGLGSGAADLRAVEPAAAIAGQSAGAVVCLIGQLTHLSRHA